MLSYATSFLIDGLKLPLSKEITIQRNVEGSEIEWALGAVYKELEDFSKSQFSMEGDINESGQKKNVESNIRGPTQLRSV